MPKSVEVTKAKLCIIEEQDIFQTLYQSVFAEEFNIEVIDWGLNKLGLHQVISRVSPDVLLVSAKHLKTEIFEGLAELKHNSPRTGVVLLLGNYHREEVDLLRRLASVSSGGLALYLKRSLDVTDQLIGIVSAVQHGQVILDPAISRTLMSGQDECSFLKQLTSREQEILHLLADGYTNAAIADALFIDLKTVEHHINNMYGKLKSMMDFHQKHPRVQAARIYLEVVGELPHALIHQAE